MKKAIQIGLITGVIAAVFSVLMLKFGEFSMQTSIINSLAVSVLICVSMIMLGRHWLRPLHDQLSYGEAMKYLFVSAIVTMILSSMVSFAVYSNDAEFYETYKEIQIRTQESLGDKFGWSEEQIEANLEKLAKSDYKYPYRLSNLPMMLVFSMLFALIYALIAAIFVKEKKAKSSNEW